MRIIYDDRQRPVQHLTATMSPERSRVLMEVPPTAIDTLSAGQIMHDLNA